MQKISSYVFTLRIIHAVLMLSVVVYGGVVWVLMQNPHEAKVLPLEILYVFMAAAAAALSAIPIVRARMRPPMQEGYPVAEEHSAPAVAAALGKLSSVSILSWALAESVAVYGLVLSILSMDIVYIQGFGALALCALLLLRPTRSAVEAVVRAASQKS